MEVREMSLGNTLAARQSAGTTRARAGQRCRRRQRGAGHVIVFSAAAAALATTLSAPARGAAIATSWAAPTSGNWIDGSKWTAGMPNNAGASTYDAIIAATGSPYTVTLNAPSSTFTVNSLTLSSPAATLDHSSGTLTVNGAMNISAGTYNLNGGVFSSGTINLTGSGTLALGSSGGLFTNGAVVNGDISLGAVNSRARFAGGSRFTGNASVTGSNAILNFESDATINAGQTILLDASGASVGIARNLSTSTDSTLTIAAGALVHGRGSVTSGNFTGGTSNAIVNNGTIAADVASQNLTINPNVFTNNAVLQSLNGATLTVSSGSFTNNGSITSTNSALAITASNWTNSAGKTISVTGGAFTTGGTWSNAGQFTLNNATTNLGGTFTTSGLNLAGLSRTGGEVNITGTLDNTAATLPLSASTGSFRLAGGTIKGGTLTRSGGADLVFTSSGGYLDGASIVGDISMSDFNSHVEMRNGGDFTGNATITGSNSILNYEYNATIGAGRTINLDGSSVALGVSRNGLTDSTLTLAPGATVRGRGSINSGNYTGGSNNQIVSNGLISADLAGQTLTVSPNFFTNNGTAQAVNTASLTISAGSWTNNGTIALNNASANFSNNWSSPGTISLANNATLNMGGTFTTGGLNLGRIVRSGASTINLTGTLDNSASTFALNATTGSFLLAGGTIKGGTITRSGGADLLITSAGGYLDSGASLVGDVTLSDLNSHVELRNGGDFTGDATLSGSSSILNYEYDATISAGRTINLAGSNVALGIAKNLTANQTSTLTIAPGATVRGRGAIDSGFYTGGTGNAVINNGTIAADVSGAALSIDPDAFTNNGSIKALNGASMTISATNWSNAATGSIALDNSAGTFSGNWSNAGTVLLSNNATLNMAGTFSTAGMGLDKLTRTGSTTISLSGSLNNGSSSLVLTPQTGSIRLSAGTISGGSITRSGGADLVFTSTGGVLSNVNLPGDVTLAESQARVELRNRADFTGSASFATSSSQITYEYDATIGAGRTFNLDQPNAQLSISRNSATSTDSTLTIAPGATVRGRGSLTSGAVTGGSNNRIVNNGLVSADISNGLLTVNPNAFTNNGTLRATGGGTLTVSANSFTNGPTGVLQATAGGKLNITHLDGSVNLNSSSADGANSVMDLRGSGYTINQPMAITNGATVFFHEGWTKSADINLGGRAIFDYPVSDPQTSPFNTLKAQVVSGYNNGAWNGPGINSAQAAANPSICGVAIAEASALFNNPNGGTFAGQSVDGTSVLVAFTRLGDADMNFSVNLSDFNRLAANFGQTGKSWIDGDFNYDGTVNLQDFNRLAQNFGLSAGPDGVVDPQDWSALAAAVPEPTTLLLLSGVPALAGMRRRRRR
jgi:filamentous hemagglutinin